MGVGCLTRNLCVCLKMVRYVVGGNVIIVGVGCSRGQFGWVPAWVFDCQIGLNLSYNHFYRLNKLAKVGRVTSKGG
jgi:hypothetical protein